MTKSEFCNRDVEFCVPPLEMSLEYRSVRGKGKTGSVTFCLGPETFGLWEAEFYRQYYNSSIRQYELTSVTYPMNIYFQPKKQNIVSDLLFYNETPSHTPPQVWDASDWIPTNLEMQMTELLANAEARDFQKEEYVVIIFLSALVLLILFGLLYVVDKTGTFSKKLIMKMPVSSNHTRESNNTEVENPYREVSKQNYDIFLSVCETDEGRISKDIANITKALKKRVFFPARDVPPNAPELSFTDAALENSKRFIIFVSEHYLQENRLFEAETIVNCVRLRGQNFPKTVLVVKLDYSELPGWLTQGTVVDWTFFGPTNHNALNLTSWIIDGRTFSQAELWFLALIQPLVR